MGEGIMCVWGHLESPMHGWCAGDFFLCITFFVGFNMGYAFGKHGIQHLLGIRVSKVMYYSTKIAIVAP